MNIENNPINLNEPIPPQEILDWNESAFQYFRLYKKMIELKAMIFFIIILVSAAYLYAQIYIRARLSDFERWTHPNFWTFDQVFYILSSVFCLVSIVACLIVMMPNLKNLVSGGALNNKNAKYQSQNHYLSDVLNKTLSKSNEEKHISDFANEARRKNNAFRLSLWSGVLCLCLIAIMILIK